MLVLVFLRRGHEALPVRTSPLSLIRPVQISICFNSAQLCLAPWMHKKIRRSSTDSAGTALPCKVSVLRCFHMSSASRLCSGGEDLSAKWTNTRTLRAFFVEEVVFSHSDLRINLLALVSTIPLPVFPFWKAVVYHISCTHYCHLRPSTIVQ